MSRKPVRPETYDETWIASAWGKKHNEDLLRDGAPKPRPRVTRAIALADIHPGQQVLDIGCGRGEIPAISAEMGAYAVGLDFSATVLAFAHQVRKGQTSHVHSAGSMELVRADACRLPFASDTFDRVTMLDIIEHLVPDQLRAMLQEVRRVLKPGGFAVIHTLPNRWVYDVTYPALHRILPRLPADPRGEIERQVHVNEQDLPLLHRMLAKSGLRHRIWLEQHIPAQARWAAGSDSYGDNRDEVYPVMVGIGGKLLEFLSMTPLKFLLCNDIFGLAWKGTKPHAAKPKLAPLDHLVCRLWPAKEP